MNGFSFIHLARKEPLYRFFIDVNTCDRYNKTILQYNSLLVCVKNKINDMRNMLLQF